MPTTPIYAIPYLALTDSPDIASLGEDLALEVEAELARIDAAVAALQSPTAVAVEGSSATLGTTSSTSYTNTLTTAGILGAAFVGPTSGKVMIYYAARAQHSASGGNTYTSIAVKTGATIGSGSSVLAAADGHSVSSAVVGGTGAFGFGSSKLVSGLTPGSDYNVALEHKIVTAGTGTYLNRIVQVVPTP